MSLIKLVQNLLSNAIKFSPNGKTITFSYDEKNSKEFNNDPDIKSVLSFSVLDQGVGIPEDEVNIIFNKFVESSKTKTGAGGTGLGLAICKEIVEGHGGTISAMNNPDGGALFTVIIPIRD